VGNRVENLTPPPRWTGPGRIKKSADYVPKGLIEDPLPPLSYWISGNRTREFWFRNLTGRSRGLLPQETSLAAHALAGNRGRGVHARELRGECIQTVQCGRVLRQTCPCASARALGCDFPIGREWTGMAKFHNRGHFAAASVRPQS
jgi:hypothetical protein